MLPSPPGSASSRSPATATSGPGCGHRRPTRCGSWPGSGSSASSVARTPARPCRRRSSATTARLSRLHLGTPGAGAADAAVDLRSGLGAAGDAWWSASPCSAPGATAASSSAPGCTSSGCSAPGRPRPRWRRTSPATRCARRTCPATTPKPSGCGAAPSGVSPTPGGWPRTCSPTAVPPRSSPRSPRSRPFQRPRGRRSSPPPTTSSGRGPRP